MIEEEIGMQDHDHVRRTDIEKEKTPKKGIEIEMLDLAVIMMEANLKQKMLT